MLTEDEARNYIDRYFPLGERGFARIWRKEDVFGTIVFAYEENETSPLKIPTEYWSVAWGVINKRSTEAAALKSLVSFFQSGKGDFEVAPRELRQEFSEFAWGVIRDKHFEIVDALDTDDPPRRYTLGFRYWGETCNHDRTKDLSIDLVKETNNPRVRWEDSPDRFMAVYGFNGC